MILVFDIGNTETTVGVFEGDALRAHWRLTTAVDRTPDELGLLLHELLRARALRAAFAGLIAAFGNPYYTRIDAPASPEQKSKLQKLSPDAVKESDLAGEPITAKLTHAPGDGAPIGGLKVVAENGWFAARPSGTENIYKIYAESFKDQGHLDAIVSEAQEIVNDALKSFDSAYQQREAR